jgi:hypothetical protein
MDFPELTTISVDRLHGLLSKVATMEAENLSISKELGLVREDKEHLAEQLAKTVRSRWFTRGITVLVNSGCS